MWLTGVESDGELDSNIQDSVLAIELSKNTLCPYTYTTLFKHAYLYSFNFLYIAPLSTHPNPTSQSPLSLYSMGPRHSFHFILHVVLVNAFWDWN